MVSPTERPAHAESRLDSSILRESTSSSMPWYKPFLGSRLTPSIRTLFETYAGVAPQDVESHITSIRSKAWHVRPYPCLGSFSFLPSTLQALPAYAPTLLPTLLTGSATFVDLGCCLGEELRWLAADGVPCECMIGIDTVPEFWELGFELFRDRGRMKGQYVCGDLLRDDGEDQGDATLAALNGNVDVLFAGNFFHLFAWGKQVRAVEPVVGWSRGCGSIECGVMIGSVEARALASGWGNGKNEGRGEQFWHDRQSWERLWRDVEDRTDTRWRIESECWRVSEEG